MTVPLRFAISMSGTGMRKRLSETRDPGTGRQSRPVHLYRHGRFHRPARATRFASSIPVPSTDAHVAALHAALGRPDGQPCAADTSPSGTTAPSPRRWRKSMTVTCTASAWSQAQRRTAERSWRQDTIYPSAPDVHITGGEDVLRSRLDPARDPHTGPYVQPSLLLRWRKRTRCFPVTTSWAGRHRSCRRRTGTWAITWPSLDDILARRFRHYPSPPTARPSPMCSLLCGPISITVWRGRHRYSARCRTV